MSFPAVATHSRPGRRLPRRLGPALIVLLLAAAWLATPHPVPLYDGIGFPDEPYRFVPARPGTPPATAAQLRLTVAGGVNTGGLIANSAEVGPQVSVYAPTHAFAVAGNAPILVAARPVSLAPPLPPGTVDSDAYDLSFTSAAGPVRLLTAAQPPALTMRSVTAVPTAPVFAYLAGPARPWRLLPTRQVGRDIFNVDVPGAGRYVLVQVASAGRRNADSSTGLFVVLGVTVLLMAVVLVAVRVLSRRRPGGTGGRSVGATR